MIAEFVIEYNEIRPHRGLGMREGRRGCSSTSGAPMVGWVESPPAQHKGGNEAVAVSGQRVGMGLLGLVMLGAACALAVLDLEVAALDGCRSELPSDCIEGAGALQPILVAIGGMAALFAVTAAVVFTAKAVGNKADPGSPLGFGCMGIAATLALITLLLGWSQVHLG